MWTSNKINQKITITEMFSFFEEHKDINFNFPGESHNFWECLYLSKGELCISADERIYNLTSGEIIFHKPLEFHKFTIESSEGADIIVFSFSFDCDSAEYFKNKVFRLSEKQKDIIYRLRDYGRENVVSGSNYLLPFMTSNTYSQMVITYIYQLLLSLIADNTVAPETSDSYDATIYKKAVNYMNSNINTNLLISNIADEYNISVSTLKRIFNKYAGISVHKYFLQMKIKRATQLLQDGNSVSNVSEKLGFSSQEYFSAAFKRETGISPSDIK